LCIVKKGAIVTSRMPDFRITLLLVGSTLLFFVLPAWAWGSVSGLLAHPARAGTFAVAVAGAIAFCFSGMDFTSLKWDDRRTRLVIPALTGVTLLLTMLPVYADRHDIMVFDGDAVRYLGLVAYAAGCLLRIGPMFTLKNRFRAPWAAQQQHYLVTTGYYRYIRHPSYFGLFLALLGWFLVFRCWIGCVVALLLVPLAIPEIRKEEKMLLDEFGEEYAAYQRRTWILPFVR
jgi:protein-S-isoprenylcysteine O-methyltransferase Ste14